jgi:predicted N-acyltransferase
MGEFVFDHGWAEAAESAGIAYYPKLLVGIPFTPATGARFLSAPGGSPERDPRPRQALKGFAAVTAFLRRVASACRTRSIRSRNAARAS